MSTPGPVSPEQQLLSIVRCPACLGTFAATQPEAATSDGWPAELTCTGCGRCYPVRNGIPVLLLDEARLPADHPTEAEAPRDE